MAEGPQAVVTPAGVRDGDPASLHALVARRGGAVLAYCATLCDPAVAPRAAAEAFARFRAAVATSAEPGALAPEPLLLGATRHAAASMARTAPSGGAPGLRRALTGRGANETCGLVPTLLAAQADGMLSAEDQDRLRRHLDRHPACRAISAAFRHAEASFDAAPARPMPPAAERLVLVALISAAPLAPGIDPSEILPALPTAEDEDTAEQAAQETQDWAAGDIAAAVAAAEAAEEPGATEAAEAEAEAAAAAVDVLPAEAPEEPAPQEAALEDPLLDEPALEEPPAADEPAPYDPDVTAVLTAVSTEDDAHDPEDGAAAARNMSPRAMPRRPLRERLHLPGEHDHGPFFRFILPGAAILLALLLAMAIAGIFDSGGEAPKRPARSAPPQKTVPVDLPASATTGVATTTTREVAKKRAERRKRSRASAATKTAATTTATTAAATDTPPPAAQTPAAAPVPSQSPAPAATPRRQRTRGTTPSQGGVRKTQQSSSLPGATTGGSTSPDAPVFTPAP